MGAEFPDRPSPRSGEAVLARDIIDSFIEAVASTGVDGLLAHDVQELGHIIAGILEKNQGAVFADQ